MADPDKKAVYEQAAKIKRKLLFSLTVAVFPSTRLRQSGQASTRETGTDFIGGDKAKIGT